jgi:hypothetical protein
MRYWELYEGVLTTIQVGKYRITVLDHVKERLKQRKLKPWHITRILDKLSTIENDIDQMELREGFFVIDRKLNISLGMSRADENSLTLITIIDSGTPHAKDVNRYFYIS